MTFTLYRGTEGAKPAGFWRDFVVFAVFSAAGLPDIDSKHPYIAII